MFTLKEEKKPMESLLRKCLNNREKSFEIDSCPAWLSKILPNRIKSVELIVENVNEPIKVPIDLTPYQLNSSIPLLNDQDISQEDSPPHTDEYPNDKSHQNQLLANSYEYLLNPSNEQIIYLLNQLKQIQSNEKKISVKENVVECSEETCSKERIPLTNYCLSHLFANDSQQILFVQCHLCQHIAFKEDKKNLLHICS